jgi:hypothetical protein
MVANPIFFIFGAFFFSVVCDADRRPNRDLMPDDMGFVPTDLINRQVNALIPMAVNDRRLAGSHCSDSPKRQLWTAVVHRVAVENNE